MKLTVAKSAGFCFGVRRSVEKAYQELEEGKGGPVYTYGPIIHNEEVVRDLERRGITILHSAKEALEKEGGTVIIRSHGISRAEEELLSGSRLRVIDMTCPFVKKIQRLAREQSLAGKLVVIAGDPGHPEVRGILGWCPGEACTAQTPDELRKILEENAGREICLAAQTTFNKNKFQDMVDLSGKMGYNVYVVNTICSATEERQEEAAQIAADADMMLVIGSKNSSNTRKLYEICKHKCNLTHYIQTAQDLTQEWFLAVEKVGVTAGASTPKNIIEEVLQNVRGFWSVTE